MGHGTSSRLALAVLVMGASLLAGATARADEDMIVWKKGRNRQVVEKILEENLDGIKVRIAGSVQSYGLDDIEDVIHGNPTSRYQRASDSLKAGDHATAATEFERCAGEATGENAWEGPYGTYWAGEAHLQGGRHDQAVAAFQAFKAKFAKHRLYPSCLYGLGMAQVGKGDGAGAEGAFQELIGGIGGEDWKQRGRVGKGRALLVQGKPGEAVAEFKAVLAAARPDSGELVYEARVGLGRAQIGAKQFRDAQDEFDKVIEVPGLSNRLYAAAYNGRGEARLGQGASGANLKEALYDYLRVYLLYRDVPEEHRRAREAAAEVFRKLGGEANERRSGELSREP